MSKTAYIAWMVASAALLVQSSCGRNKRYEFLNPEKPEARVQAQVHQDSIRAIMPLDSIKLTRRGRGSRLGPTYTVTLRRDGSVSYYGGRAVKLTGLWRGQIAVNTYARLNQFSESVGLLDKAHAKSDLHMIETDGWEFVLDLWPTGAKAPIEFQGYYDWTSNPVWILCSAIDGVTNHVKWTAVQPGEGS